MISQLFLALTLWNLPDHSSTTTLPRNLLLGHRGARAQAPENTLPSFKLALELGAHGIEFDVYFSKDKVPVIMHDDTLERTTNGKGPVWEKTLSELRELDAAKSFPEFAGTQIPTLAETLHAMPDGAVVNIELKGSGNFTKEDLVDAVLDVMRSERDRLYIIVSSFDTKLLEILRQRDSDVFIGFLLWEHNFLTYLQALADMKSVKPNALHISSYLATSSIIARAHAKGLKVHVWTINDKTEAKSLREKGVDGIFSDLPKGWQ